MRNLAIMAVVGLMALPNVVNAAWWNPFSWSIFKRQPVVVEKIIYVQATTTPAVATTTPPVEVKKAPVVDNSAAVIKAQVKAQVEATLKAKAEQDALISKQKAEELARIETQVKIDAENKRLSLEARAAKELAAELLERENEILRKRLDQQQKIIEQAKTNPVILAPVPVVKPRGSLSISGGNNAFQISLRGHDKGATLSITSYDSALLEGEKNTECVDNSSNTGITTCNTYHFFVNKNFDPTDVDSALPNDGRLYQFKMTVFGEQHTVSVKKAPNLIVFENK